MDIITYKGFFWIPFFLGKRLRASASRNLTYIFSNYNRSTVFLKVLICMCPTSAVIWVINTTRKEQEAAKLQYLWEAIVVLLEIRVVEIHLPRHGHFLLIKHWMRRINFNLSYKIKGSVYGSAKETVSLTNSLKRLCSYKWRHCAEVQMHILLEFSDKIFLLSRLLFCLNIPRISYFLQINYTSFKEAR